MKLLCNLETAEIRALAKELNEKPAIITNRVSIWQSRTGTAAIPTIQELKDLQINLDDEKSGLIPENAKLVELTIDSKKVPFFVDGAHIFDTNGELVHNEDGDLIRNKIYANLAVQEKRAVIVRSRINLDDYVVNNRGQIIDMDGNIRNTNTDKKDFIDDLIEQANDKLKSVTPSQWLSHSTSDLPEETMVPKAQEYVPEQIDYVPVLRNIPDEMKATAVAKLSSVFSPIQLTARISNVARLFSEAIDVAYDRKLEELNQRLEELPNNAIEKIALSIEIQKLQDSKNGRNAFLDTMNVNEIIEEVKRGVKRKIQRVRTKLDKQTSDKGLYILDQWTKVDNNIDLLLVHALSEIEANERIKISLSQNKTVNGDNKLGGNQVAYETETEDDSLEERVVSGNSGWAFETRKADPHTSSTRNVKRILRSLPMIGKNGVEKDDIGEMKYVDGEYAYATLLNNLSWMIDSTDFHTVDVNSTGKRVLDEDGEEIHHLPALDELVKRYTWLNGVLNELYSNPDLIPEFYSCFRMDFIQTNMIGSTGHFAPVNREMGIENAINSITRNYEQGIILDENSIFGKNQNTILENAKLGESLADKLMINLLNRDFDEEDYEVLIKILHMLGIETNENLPNFLNWREDEVKLKSLEKVIRNARIIFNNLPTLTESDHLIASFKTNYEEIATIVGEVTEFNRAMTFRQGDADYPSYSTPNFATTQFKKLTSDNGNRRNSVLDMYKMDDFFYDKKNRRWKNTWLEELENNTALRETLQKSSGLVNMYMIREATTFGSEAVEYKDWTPQQIRKSFLAAYWSADTGEATSDQHYAYYNFPIFSDTECAMFVKFLRYTGENYQNKILPLLRKFVYQEFTRMLKVEQRRNLGQDIANYDKNGDKFFIFPELNDYKVRVSYDRINAFYDARYNEASPKEKEIISDKLTNLGIPSEDGTVSASFVDVIKMYRNRGDVQAINNIVDEAIITIMNNNFNSFYNEAIKSDDLLDIMVQEAIVPESEVKKLFAEDPNSVTTNNDKEKTQFSNVRDALEEYFWNNMLAQHNLIQIMVGDLAFYKNDNGVDFQKRFKEVYASGRKLDTSSKYGKEFENTIYLTDRITTSRRFSKIQQIFEQAVAENKISQRDANDILEKFKEINNADAQAFRSPKSMRAVLDMAGMWDENMENAYNRLVSGEFDVSDFSVIWQTIKPFMYTLISIDDGLGGKMTVPHQNKNSEFLLLASYSMVSAATEESTRLRALCKFMEDNDIDVIQYESAVKSGSQGTVDINYSVSALEKISEATWSKLQDAAKKELRGKYKSGKTYKNFKAGADYLLDKGELTDEQYENLMSLVEPSEEEIIKTLHDACYKPDGTFNNVVVHQLPYSAYVIQTPTPEHWIDNKVVDGSQKRNLLPADMPDDPNFRVFLNGKEYTKQQILDLYDSIIVEDLIDSYQDVKEEVENIDNLQKSLLQQIKGNPKYSRDFVNALTLTEYNGKKDFTIPLDFPTVQNQIVQLILAKFKNGVTKQKAKGGTCIIAADTDNRLNIILEDGSTLNTKDEKAVELAKKNNQIKGFECFLPAWSKKFYEKYLITKKKNGKTWTELDFERLKKEAPELLEMSGIRIPTEGKYSITPLIVKGFLPAQSGSAIMLPADITLITGCDMDVDKMFIRVYNFEDTDEGFKKIEYDYSKSPKLQSRQARENALLDIELAIMRSKATAEALFSPGTFDPIKKSARMTEILSGLSNSNRSLMTIWQEEHKINKENLDETIASIENAELDELTDFVNRFSKLRNIGSIETFIYNHQQNMAGAALIGMYANNTTAQAKCQTTNLAIKDPYTFTINNKRIKSLHDIYTEENGKQVRISKNCAYFSAASVDNVKDPVLAKIRQNVKTAPICGFMLRAGMSVKDISLLFCQPQISYLIDNDRKLDGRNILGQIKYLKNKFGIELSKQTEQALYAQIFKENFTTKKFAENIAKWNKYRAMTDSEMNTLPEQERMDYVTDLIKTLYLFYNICVISEDLRGSVGISRADSPNGAIEITLEDANIQVERVDDYLSKSDDDAFTLENIQDIMQNRVVSVEDNVTQLRRKLLNPNVKIKRLQAFYSLGIELAQQVIGKYFISQSPEAQKIVSRIEAELGKTLNAKKRRNLYKDFITYILSATDEFGQDFEQKRNYYLYQFPKQFDTTLKQNPDLASIPALNALRVVEGRIVMDNSHRLSPIMQESIRNSFDQLLFGENEIGNRLAQDLFMYAYYNEGFNFSHNSYGHFFSTTFLMSFPNVLNALRNTHPDATVMNNFFEQWIAQKENLSLIHQLEDNNVISNSTENTITIPIKDVPINYDRRTGSMAPYSYITVSTTDNNEETSTKLYTLVSMDNVEATYAQVPTINPGITLGSQRKYNANVTAGELARNNTEESRIANAKLLNTTSYKRSMQAKETASDNAANNVENLYTVDALEGINVDINKFDNNDSYSNIDINNFENSELPSIPQNITEAVEQQNLKEYDESLANQVQIDNNGKPLC